MRSHPSGAPSARKWARQAFPLRADVLAGQRFRRPRRKPPLDGPGPVRLATPHPPGVSPIDPPEDRRSEPKRGPTLPAGFERMFSIDDLAALLNCSRRLVERMRSCGKVPPGPI